MNYDLLIELVTRFKEFSLAHKDEAANLNDFRIWLNQNSYNTGVPTDSGHKETLGNNDVDVEISKLVIYLSRYARHLMKKGLLDYQELVNDDITYIYTLMSSESMTKMQLIEKNIHEKPTGMEIIKRLIRFGLIDETADEQDKRSKRIFLTPKGKELFFRSLEKMKKISKIITGDLSASEKSTLMLLLKKLDDYHNPIFLEEKNIDIDALASKTVNT